MKRKLSFIMCLLMIFSCIGGNYVNAMSNDEVWTVENVDGYEAVVNNLTGEKLLESWTYDDKGNKVKLDPYVYADQLNMAEEIKEEDLAIANNTSIAPITSAETPKIRSSLCYYELITDYTNVTLGDATKVTPTAKGPCQIYYGESVSFSYSNSFSIGVNADIIDTYEISTGFEWSYSCSTGSEFGITYNIDSGKSGYVEFRPFYYHARGTLIYHGYVSQTNYHYTTNYGYGILRCPKMLATGFCDGIYSLVQS